LLLLSARCALLDIEGTVADIRFVYDVMFPFVREHLERYLKTQSGTPELDAILQQLARDAGLPTDPTPWHAQGPQPAVDMQAVSQHVLALMDGDSKSTGLKALQGRIWESGFRSGALRAEVFEDVVPALKQWRDAGIDLKIYSSGSILAQKLFFGHTTQGDLTPLFTGYFDTTTGPKRQSDSYRTIAEQCGLAPEQIVFFTDVLGELEAATAAGVQTVAVVRPNNAPLPDAYSGPLVNDLRAIRWR
jgi:enolase-phosphatase E1